MNKTYNFIELLNEIKAGNIKERTNNKNVPKRS